MAAARGLLVTTVLGLLLATTYLFYLNMSLERTLDSLSLSSSTTSKPHVTLLGSILEDHVPTAHNARRLIVVGDIHGMSGSLEKLLEKVSFNPESDHLVATGDMISKGPDSAGVIDKLMELNASAVRGNHEDHVLKARAKLDRKKRKHRKHRKSSSSQVEEEVEEEEEEAAAGTTPDEETSGEDEDGDVDATRAKARDRQTARSLSKKHIIWLQSLPVILSADPLPIYIVHAGLVPGLQVRKQDPWAVMNMRTLRYPKHQELRRDETLQVPSIPDESPLSDAEARQEDQQEQLRQQSGEGGDDVDAERSSRPPIPTDGRSGQRWADAWNKYQRHLPHHKRRTVIYGHDAKRGHRVGDYTYGLDSGCVVGGKLTAVVIEGKKGGGYHHKTVQISCKKA